MGLGAYALGMGPIGHDPVADPSAAGVAQALAPLIHPGSKDAVVLSSGLLQGVHPVDQAVCLALGITRSTLGSLPRQGQGILGIEYRSRGFATLVRFAVESALAMLINRRDVELLDVREDEGAVLIEYRNLRLLAEETAPSTTTTLRVPVS